METDTNGLKKLASACDFVILVTTRSQLVADSDLLLTVIDWLGSGTKASWLGLDAKTTWLGWGKKKYFYMGFAQHNTHLIKKWIKIPLGRQLKRRSPVYVPSYQPNLEPDFILPH